MRHIRRWMALVLVAALVCLQAVPVSAETAKGTTLKLEQTEGKVKVTGKNGKKVSVSEGMKLYSGYSISTGSKSYAYVSLDSKKAVKLDASSSAEIKKSGKKLEVLLKSGNLFFNIKEPLKEDETLKIRTSTMVTGIRGTSGIIKVIDESSSSLSLLDGSVMLTVTESGSQEAQTVNLTAGQTAVSSLSAGTGSAAPAVAVQPLSSQQVPGFAAVEIAKDQALQKKVAEQTKLEVSSIIKDAEKTLVQEQEKADQEEKKIETAVKEEKTAVDSSVFDKPSTPSGSNGSGGGNSGGGSGSGDPNPPEPPRGNFDLQETYGPPSASGEYVDRGQLFAALQKNKKIEIVGSGTEKETLVLQRNLLIDGDQSLELTGINLRAEQATTTNINGRLIVNGSDCSVTLEGFVLNIGSDSVKKKGGMQIEGDLVVKNTFMNNGSVVNRGQITIAGSGSLQNSGTIAVARPMKVTQNGRLSLEDGIIITSSPTGGAIDVEGTVTVSDGVVFGADYGVSLSGAAVLLLEKGGIYGSEAIKDVDPMMEERVRTSPESEFKGLHIVSQGGLRTETFFVTDNLGQKLNGQKASGELIVQQLKAVKVKQPICMPEDMKMTFNGIPGGDGSASISSSGAGILLDNIGELQINGCSFKTDHSGSTILSNKGTAVLKDCRFSLSSLSCMIDNQGSVILEGENEFFITFPVDPLDFDKIYQKLLKGENIMMRVNDELYRVTGILSIGLDGKINWKTEPVE